MLCEKMGFAADGDRGYHDISLRSSDGIHLELHFSIKENLENVDSTLIRVWEYARPVEGWKHQYCQTPEFFVFHSLAHMSYHFIFGGCGLRPMIDFYLIRTKMEYNVEEVRALCRQCKIETFFDRLNELIDALFEGKNHTTMTLRMLTYLINGGVYGTQVNRIAVQQSRKGSKIRYLMYRIFMPYEELIIHYPVLERHRWLMPICWVRRWFRLFRVRTLKSSVRELRAANAVTDDQARVIGELLGDLKLL